MLRRPHIEGLTQSCVERVRQNIERLMQSGAVVFGATAHPSFGQFTLENRLFRVESAGGVEVE